LYRALADACGLPFVNMDWIKPDPDLVDLRPLPTWRAARCFPLKRIAGSLELAVATLPPDPLEREIEQELSVAVTRVLVCPGQIDEYLALAAVDRDQLTSELAALHQGADGRLEITDESASRLGRLLVLLAKKERASDIHIEPLADDCRVRLRVDGRLHEVISVTAEMGAALVNTYKVSADLDIAEQRRPQDGRMSIGSGDTVIDMRVSTVPTRHGEKMVIRILDARATQLDLNVLSFSSTIATPYRALLQRPHGILFVTGPTGSGKTTTLYASLAEMDSVTRNITTIEDPVEDQLGGINQIQVNQRIGLGFATVLRSCLRQDPDVLLIGEIRDAETAEVAVRAALTGHLVLTTMHTNDAPSAITRLEEMGISPHLVAQAVIGVMAQRLVPRICASCRREYAASAQELAVLGVPDASGLTLYRGVGCEECHGRGYRGRVPVHELLCVDDAVAAAVAGGATAVELMRHARNAGYRPLRHDGAVKALAGYTTASALAEVLASHEGG
jgi:type IV pilus assembly protein PilB